MSEYNHCPRCKGTALKSFTRDIIDPILNAPEGVEYKKLCINCGASVTTYMPVIGNPIRLTFRKGN